VLAVCGMRVIRSLSAAISAAILLGSTTPAAAATLTADYRFQGTLASSVGPAPDLANLGPGASTYATKSLDGQVRAVLSFPAGNGANLTPTTGVAPDDRYSIVILFLFADVNGYRRVLALNNGQNDYGVHTVDGLLTSYGNNSYYAAHGTINADACTADGCLFPSPAFVDAP